MCYGIRAMNIRLATTSDHDVIWSILHAVIAAGDTYVFDPEMTREDAFSYWLRKDSSTYVAEENGQLVGTYILKPNQQALGSHVANAAFMVAPSARRVGVGRRMAEHCLNEARRLGFLAMQFNFVVSTNEAAIRLWLELGFRTVGTLPKAFRRSQHGYVDAYVMFRELNERPSVLPERSPSPKTQSS
jgi:L-amino acid N-acyltransferase YncA